MKPQEYDFGLFSDLAFDQGGVDCNDEDVTDFSNCSWDYQTMNFTTEEGIWVRKPAWEIAIKSIAIFPIMTIGIVGNIAVICFILHIKSLRASHINLFILNMAIADLLTILICPWMGLIQNVYQNYMLGPFFCKLETTKMLFLLASVLSLVTISIDRFIAFVFPFKRHLNRKTSIVIIVVIWVVAILLTIPLFVWRVYHERQWMNYLEKWCTEIGPFSKIYWSFLMLPLIYFPLLVMVVVYSVIIRRMDYFEKRVSINETPIKMKHRRTIIQMLFIYILTIIICWLPLQITVFYRRFKPAVWVIPPWYANVCFISQLLATANSAINPIVTFRKSFAHLLPQMKKQKRPKNRMTPTDVAIIRNHLEAPPMPSLASDSTQKKNQMLNISNGLHTNTMSFTKQIMMKRAPEIFMRDDS